MLLCLQAALSVLFHCQLFLLISPIYICPAVVWLSSSLVRYNKKMKLKKYIKYFTLIVILQ